MTKRLINFRYAILAILLVFHSAQANYGDSSEIVTLPEKVESDFRLIIGQDDSQPTALDEVILVAGGNPSDWRLSKACRDIYPEVLEALDGNEDRAKCYMGLFFMETTCRHTLTQKAGNAGNAHAAYGLCSLEKSASVREDNNRGPDCKNIQGVTNQVKCCRAIMVKSPTYFGPYNRGAVPQCG